ncbi:MAG: Ig-like domain-containing protein, partial [Pseudomonadota bacterium]
ANDADPDSDPLTGRITTFPRFGCVRLFDSGGTQLGGDCNPTVDFAEGTVFVYEPDENATGDPSGTDGFGTDTFIYEITDGTATSAAIVTLTIEAVDDDPVVVAAVAAPPVSDRSGTVEINLLSDANVTDPDGDELTVTEVVLTSLDSPLDLTTIPFSEADGVLSFEASDLNGLDDGESAALLFTYTVSDGSDPTVENVAAITVSGSDNGVIGNPGQYANTLSGRYNGHFGTQNDANASCHTCHEPGNVNADLDTLADCTATGPNGLPLLTAYGRDICLGRPEGAEPLSDLLRRLEVVEADYAPILADPGPLTISELDAIDTEIARLTTSQAGQTITGATADIIDYRFAEPGNDAALRSRRLSPGNGFFRVGETGVLTLAERPAPGVYTLDIRPVNDAKQRDNEGADRDGIAGFFPVRTAQLTVVTITVLSEAVTAVDDTATTVSNAAVVVDVLANDTGGTATVVTLGDAPANGAAEVASEFPFAITYTPDATFTGTDTFTYVATNDANAPSTGTVTVTVLPAGALVAVDDAVSVASGVTTLIDVLGNDVNAIAAGEDGATVVTLEGELSPGEAGTVTLNGQELEFAAAEGFTGTATLQYAATNPNVAGDTGTTATVTLSVQAFGSGVISDAVDDPELSRVAVALEDTCAAVDPGASAEAAAFVAACSGLAAAAGAGDDLTQAMEALRNEEHFAAVDATMTMARGLGQTLGRRLDRVQSGGLRGVDLSGITMTLGEVTLPAELAEAASAALGARNTDGEGPGDIGMFVAGDITIATRDGDGTAASYDVYAGNLMIGVDRRFAGDLTLGLALGGTGSVTDFSDGGELVGRGLQFAIYGYRDNFGAPNVSLSGYAAVGYTQFDSERRIVFTSGGADVDETADASFDGYYLNIAPTLAVTRTLGEGRALADPLTDVEVRLYTTLDYLYTYIGEYTETGGGGFDLAVEAESYHSLVGSIGVDASRPLYPSPNIRMEVFGGVALNGEFLDGDRSVTSSFAIGGPGAPTFVATEDGSSFLSGSGEIGAAFGFGRSTLEFGYGIDYGGPSSLTTHRLGLGFATSFLKQDRLGVSVRRSASADGGGWGTELDYGIRF